VDPIDGEEITKVLNVCALEFSEYWMLLDSVGSLNGIELSVDTGYRLYTLYTGIPWNRLRQIPIQIT
jgi:hypothetical protein